MGFAEARAVYIDQAAALYRNAGLLNKAVNTLQRHAVFGCALHIHARHVFGGSETELTLTRLQRLASEHGGISPGRVAAQVLLLRKLGFIETRPAADRRQRLLLPTPSMIAEDLRWLTAQLRPLEHIGSFMLTDAEATTPDFALAFRMAHAMAPTEFAAFLGRHPSITFFSQRDGGYSMLLELMRARLDGRSTRIGFDVAGTASAYFVSKSQLWSLLRAAEERQLLTPAAPAWREIVLSQQLLDDFDHWFQDKADGMAIAAVRARSILEQQ